MAGRASAEQHGQHGLVDTGERADGVDAAGAQLVRRHPADAPHPLDGQRVQELQLAVARHVEQAVRLGERARHLGEELRARDADADRQPDPLADRAPQAHRNLDGRAGDRLHPASVEERLVDRQPLDERRHVVEDRVEILARLRVCRHSRRDDDRLGAEPARFPAAHRRPDSARLRLVARREYDAAAHDHRAAAQASVVALLDRREERVRVRVQDRPRTHHERMFAWSQARRKRTLAPGASWPASGRSAARTTAITG